MINCSQKLILQNWNAFAEVAVLQQVNFSTQTLMLREKQTSDIFSGYYVSFDSVLYRCFAFQEHLLFFDGKDHVDLLDDEIRIVHTMDDARLKRNTFILIRSFKIIFSIVYPSVEVPFDVTRDAIDDEADDFWLWFSKQLCSMANRKLIFENWSKGFKH